MYAFRKPFTAGSYVEPSSFGGVGYKSILVTAQVLGYTLSKFIGIKVVAEVAAAPPGHPPADAGWQRGGSTAAVRSDAGPLQCPLALL